MPPRSVYDPERVAAGRRLVRIVVVSLIVVAVGVYGFHLYRNYQKIEARLRLDEDLHSKPFDDDQTASEVGYVYYMNRDLRLREGRLVLVWGVKIADGTDWSCEYEGGFSQFREGDVVRLVRHKNAEDEGDYTAYLVGIRGGNVGTVSQVQAIDANELAGEAIAAQD